MIPAFTFLSQLSNACLIFLSGIVLLYLLKSLNLKDKFWFASVVSILFIVLISLGQIASYYGLVAQLREKEQALESLKVQYAVLKSSTEAAGSAYGKTKRDVAESRRQLEAVRAKVDAEFNRTIREIRKVYSTISDEEMNRRFNDAVRTAKQNLRNNVFTDR